MAKKSKYQHPANPERAAAEAERRRSNAAGTHADKRTARERSRAAKKRAAIQRGE